MITSHAKLLILISLILSGSKEDNEQPKFSLVDAFGHDVARFTLPFEHPFSDQASFYSAKVMLKLKGEDRFGVVDGEVSGCRIGAHKLEGSQTILRLDGLRQIPIERALKGFDLTLQIFNPKGWQGVITCDQIVIFADRQPMATALTEGEVLDTPEWQDSASQVIGSITFSFAGLIAGPVSGVNVDSQVSIVRLVGAVSYPATIGMVRPRGCRIGTTSVNNARVHFLNNGTPVTNNVNIQIPSSSNQSYAIRFAAAGNHGDDSGAVFCNNPGSLTYTY